MGVVSGQGDSRPAERGVRGRHLAGLVAEILGGADAEATVGIMPPALDAPVGEHCACVHIADFDGEGGFAELDGGGRQFARVVAQCGLVAVAELSELVVSPAADRAVGDADARATTPTTCAPRSTSLPSTSTPRAPSCSSASRRTPPTRRAYHRHPDHRRALHPAVCDAPGSDLDPFRKPPAHPAQPAPASPARAP